MAAERQLPTVLSESQQEFDLSVGDPALDPDLYLKQATIVREIFSMIDMSLSDRDLARLFGAFGSVHGILASSHDALKSHVDISPQQFKFLFFTRNITWKMIGCNADFRLELPNSKKLYEYLRQKYAFSPVQLAIAIYLDGSGRLVHESVEKGTVGEVHLSARSIGRLALTYDADSVVFARTTACYSNRPKKTDITFDRVLSTFLEGIRVRVVDYVILGKNGALGLRGDRTMPITPR